MKRVLFVYRNVLKIPYIDFGIASLSAVLKSKGHEVGLIDFTFGLSEKAAIEQAKEFAPDLICFSARSNEFEHIAEFAQKLKNVLSVPILCGGVHPSVAPEDSLRACFDGICRGEGELALLDLVEKLDAGKPYTDTGNFWFRKGKKIIKNMPRPLIKDLDSLPLFNYELFDMARYIKARDGQIDYMGMRGCPFRCSYCINHVMQNLYKGTGGYVRLKSIDKMISELKQLISRYDVKNIFFPDEIFNISTPRLKEFAEKYPKEIGLPFECSARADLCSEENMRYLAKAKCSKLSIAIESGDPELRKGLLNKNISNEQIVKAFQLARKHGIHTMSYNMIGLPFESPKQIEKTIALNKEAMPDSIQVSTFVPFPGTELYEFSRKNNLLVGKEMEISYYFGVYLKNPNLSPKTLKHYRRWFSYLCYEDRSKLKAGILLLRDSMIPFYLKFGGFIPPALKKVIYRLFWNTKQLKFIGK